MSIRENHDVVSSVMSRQEVLDIVGCVLDSLADKVLQEVLKGDEAQAGRLIALALDDVFEDEANGIQESREEAA